jgi:hypothetical protein
MPDTIIPPAATLPSAPSGARRVDVRRGALDGSLSSQWYTRPDDQRFLSLDDLLDAVKARMENSIVNTYGTRSLRVLADENLSADTMRILAPDGEGYPTHWSFSQLCQHIDFPARYLRRTRLAPAVVQDLLSRSSEESIKLLKTTTPEGRTELRAITSPTYGRVWDADVVEAVKAITEDGTWKVPGVIDWTTGTYDPNPDYLSKQSTTLYASDRDVFLFLCRDQYPIEIGKLDNGDPDLIFPGFMVSNSEVGAASLRVVTMYLRAICLNRNLWGVEGRNEIALRHTSGLPDRFRGEVMPTLKDFSNISASAVARKAIEAKRLTVAKTDDEALEWLGQRDFSKSGAKAILESVMQTEGRPARSIWDMVQGITAMARDIPHQDERVALERKAGALMNKVTI